jgi:hypothetical protein
LAEWRGPVCTRQRDHVRQRHRRGSRHGDDRDREHAADVADGDGRFFHAFLLVFGVKWPTPIDAAMLVCSGIANAVGQFFWTRALHLAPATAVSPFFYLMLVWALIIGYVVWGDGKRCSDRT